ncbi:MAG: hypothetical protein HYX51_08145 [Chloroflexi bacterium]|nr:hypothetical protein [Chloroflexota bacterium]
MRPATAAVRALPCRRAHTGAARADGHRNLSPAAATLRAVHPWAEHAGRFPSRQPARGYSGRRQPARSHRNSSTGRYTNGNGNAVPPAAAAVRAVPGVARAR